MGGISPWIVRQQNEIKMPGVQSIADPNYVTKQYRSAANLKARMRLHQAFSTNPYGWQRWLFDQFKLTPYSRVLELGCGPGDLWLENDERIPEGMELVLTDLSAGMLIQAQRNLKECHRGFHFYVVDAQAIPFERNSFEVVIANHMLYHVPDRAQALTEIQRVLRPGGHFYASTIGNEHLKELSELVARFEASLTCWGKLPSDSFNLENGAAQLGAYFGDVALQRYPDALNVTEAGLLAEYILSGRIELSAEQQLELARFVEQALKANGGRLYITKDSGVFAASGNLKQ